MNLTFFYDEIDLLRSYIIFSMTVFKELANPAWRGGLALGRHGYVDLYEFEASPIYLVSSRVSRNA